MYVCVHIGEEVALVAMYGGDRAEGRGGDMRMELSGKLLFMYLSMYVYVNALPYHARSKHSHIQAHTTCIHTYTHIYTCQIHIIRLINF